MSTTFAPARSGKRRRFEDRVWMGENVCLAVRVGAGGAGRRGSSREVPAKRERRKREWGSGGVRGRGVRRGRGVAALCGR